MKFVSAAVAAALLAPMPALAADLGPPGYYGAGPYDDYAPVVPERRFHKKVIVERPLVVERSVVVERPVVIERRVVVERPVIVEKHVFVERPVRHGYRHAYGKWHRKHFDDDYGKDFDYGYDKHFDDDDADFDYRGKVPY
jgi:hypothetical protein